MTDPTRHDDVYSDRYYCENVDSSAQFAAGPIAQCIVRDLKPHSIVDVGCGTGALLVALRERGVLTFGLEYSTAGLARCEAQGLDVRRFDIECDPPPFDGFAVACSLEVAEHLPERVADTFVALLCRLAPTVVLTAAHPGQGGVDHVNEQMPSYWIERFGVFGFVHDAVLSLRWSYEWMQPGSGVADWYRNNLMIFRRAA